MIKEYSRYHDICYITGSERRQARQPRRSHQKRRYRIRFESLLSDCRSGLKRRCEDEEGFFEFENLYLEKSASRPE